MTKQIDFSFVLFIFICDWNIFLQISFQNRFSPRLSEKQISLEAFNMIKKKALELTAVSMQWEYKKNTSDVQA